MIRLDHHELSGGAPVRESSQLLNVVIVHDDLPAYGAALRLLVRSLGESVGATSVQPLPWKFSHLTERTWRERAWDDAARADIFVVAKAPGTPLPQDMVDWLEMSFERRRNRATAVIWLEAADADESLSVERQRLRRSAEAAGLDFLERRDVSAVPALAARLA